MRKIGNYLSKGFLMILLPISLYLFSFVGFIISFYTIDRWNVVLGNSDLLYSYDLLLYLRDGGSLSQWLFPPSVYLFPDLMISSFVFLTLQFLNFCFSWTIRTDVHFVLTTLLYQLLIIKILYKILKTNIHFKISLDKLKPNLFAKLVLVFVIFNLINIKTERFLDLSLITNHSGSILTFSIIYYCIQKEYWSLGILINFLAGMSDSFIPSIILPFYLVLGYKIISKRKLLFLYAISCIIGISAIHCSQWLGWIQIGSHYYLDILSGIEYSNFWNFHSLNNIFSIDSRLVRVIQLWLSQFLQNFYWNTILLICYSFPFLIKIFSRFSHLNGSIFISKLIQINLIKPILRFCINYRINKNINLKLTQNSNQSFLLDFYKMGMINLSIVFVYTWFSIFLPLRYLPLFSIFPFVLGFYLFRLRFLYILSFCLVLAFGIGVYLSAYNTYVNFKKPIASQEILEEIMEVYPNHSIKANYWAARPLRLYSEKLNQQGITPITKDGFVLNWIDRKRKIQNFELDNESKEFLTKIYNKKEIRPQWIILMQD